MKGNLRSSRNIWMVSILIFAMVAALMIFSTRYMNHSIQKEEEAQTKRMEYRQLGEDLADASDYLTAEVRYYAVTGRIEHLANYWNEIFHTKERERVISAFENNQDSPENEKKLLQEAKKYSDLLVETETCSMKLVLLSKGDTVQSYADDKQVMEYIEYVLSYELSEEQEKLTAEEMRSEAVKILYDKNYETYKNKIMTPIEEFTRLMNTRMDQEVEKRKNETKIATVIQVVLAVVELMAIAFLLYLMNGLYIRPLKNYTKDIMTMREKVIPTGAWELVQFAEAFNRLTGLFVTARDEAESANQAKSIFLAQMSHELRTPLNAVNGYTYLLEQTKLDVAQRKYLQSIRYSSEGLLTLINQILDFSKIESGHMEMESVSFHIREMLQELRAVFQEQADRKGLLYNVEVQQAVPDCIMGDPLRFRQVLVNLIGNAFKFTEMGSVTVSVRLLKKEKYTCLLYIAVADTGIGIEPEVKEKIFQPFIQTDASVTRKYGGTGLGLTISKEIVAASGNGTHELQVKSEPGKGAVFWFEMDFPYLIQTVEEKEESLQIPDCHGRKVLLTDDSEINIRVQSEILSLCNLIVFTAESGMQALEILEKQGDIDLIFMDIRMPEMDGYETTQRIRKMNRYRETPIIALTADAVPQVREKIAEAGMNGLLLKPTSQRELFHLLENSFAAVPLQEVFDEAACLRQLNGNELALVKILERFLVLHEQDEEKLAGLIKQKKYRQAEELVHQIKGISGNLKCDRLYHFCREFQQELEQENPIGMEKFRVIWNDTRKALMEYQKFFMKQEKQNTETDKKGLYQTVLELSSNYDTEAVALLEENMEVIREDIPEDRCAGLQEAMLQYDFETISREMMLCTR